MSIVPSRKQGGPVVITHEQAQRGFAELFNSPSQNLDIFVKQHSQHHCLLDGHPFGLETKLGSSVQSNQVWLIAYTGVTEPSVTRMKIVLRCHAVKHPMSQSTDFRLRIIRIQLPELHWTKPGYIHNLFFELITPYGTFICGGVNDYSGEGGHGGRQLESVFNFIAALYEKPVEEVLMSEVEAEPMWKRLDEAYSAFTQEQRNKEVA